MTAYAQLRSGRPSPASAPRNVVAVGDPVYDPKAAPVQEALRRARTMGMALSPLPETRQQVTEIVRLYQPYGVSLLDKQATQSAVLMHGGEARILHLACHGWADEHDPLGSWLALSPEGPKDSGLLFAADVLEHLKLHADLVTLAACQTGLGTETKNEGVAGMARVFQLAGAQSVLASLWSVDVHSTNALMIAFYRNLEQIDPKTHRKRTKDEALRQAQLSLLYGVTTTYRDPYYWAGFALIGDWK